MVEGALRNKLVEVGSTKEGVPECRGQKFEREHAPGEKSPAFPAVSAETVEEVPYYPGLGKRRKECVRERLMIDGTIRFE